MDKTIISALSAVMALSCVAAQAEEFEDAGITVITENFKVEDVKKSGESADGNSLLIVRDQNEIGSLGDKVVVAGEKDPKHLAFVKTADNHNYIITNKILVQCAKDQYCIPAGLEVEQISKNIYEITVHDYDQWQSLKDELGNTEGVRSVSVSYDHGIEPDLK